jgi:hypothetical protein
MVEIAEKDPRQIQELSKLLEDVPWRMERFGQQILQVVREG